MGKGQSVRNLLDQLMNAKEEIGVLKSVLKDLDKENTFLSVQLREEKARSGMFEAALKSKQNYYIPSNSHWYRKNMNG